MRKLLNEELGRISVEVFKSSPKIPVAVVLDNVRSAHNTGAAFRTSDAFRVERLCLCGITAKPPHKEIRKTALGATDSVQWEYFSDSLEAIRKLKEEGYTIFSVEQTDRSIDLVDYVPEKDCRYALVFGNEMRGVDQAVIDQCDHSIEIPQSGTKHSLNVSVSVGVVLWEFYKRFHKEI